jgi:hypothetical protein
VFFCFDPSVGLLKQTMYFVGVGLRPLDCGDCGFESRRAQEYLSVLSVVFCQVEVSATGRSLVQKTPTECGVSE